MFSVYFKKFVSILAAPINETNPWDEPETNHFKEIVIDSSKNKTYAENEYFGI